LLVHPGVQHAPRLAEALEREGLLARFWTGWAVAGSEGGKRHVQIPVEKLRTRRWVEWLALAMNRAGLPGERVWHWRNAIFQKLVSASEIQAADVVIGFDTASWILARRAKAAGKKFVLEQSIMDPQAKEEVLRAMAKTFPDWNEESQKRSKAVLLAERQEHTLADKVSVPSGYVAKSLIRFGVPSQKVFLNPYGVNPMPSDSRRKNAPTRTTRFLFAGTVCGRKGVPVLLEAWKNLGSEHAELTIAGDLRSWPKRLVRPADVKFTGVLSRMELAQAFQEHDVFVFPSYAEGMPLVALEAMSFGLPVIGTPVLAGVVKEGSSGYIIPAGDSRALTNAMQKFVTKEADSKKMGDASRNLSKEFSWAAYGDRYSKALLEVVPEPYRTDGPA